MKRNFRLISSLNSITLEVISYFPGGADFRCRGNLYPQLLSSWSSRRSPILQFHSSGLRWLRRCPTKESPKRKVHLHRHRSHWMCPPFPTQLIVDYVCLSDIHKLRPNHDKKLHEDDPERYMAGLPVVSFRLTDEFKSQYPQIKQASVSTLLRVKGWILPNYPLPPTEEKTEILRVVVRESFSSSKPPRTCVANGC